MNLLHTIHAIEAEVDLLQKTVNLKEDLDNKNMLLVKIVEICRDKGYVDLDTLKILFGEFGG